MNHKTSQHYTLLLLALVAVASGCIHDDMWTGPDTSNVDEAREDIQQTKDSQQSEESSEEGNQQSSFGTVKDLGNLAGKPSAVAQGSKGDYWILANGFEENENQVYRFTDNWEKTDESHQIYPGDKITYDIHFANGNWWVLAGVQGEKEVFKYTSDWEYTGESHEFSDEDIGNIHYDNGWVALGGPEGSTIFSFGQDWEMQDSRSIQNSSLENYMAVYRSQDGWDALATTSDYKVSLVTFDAEWDFRKSEILDRGTPEDLIRTDEGVWILDSLNDEIYLSN